MTIFGDGQQTRAFSYVGDVAPLIARAIEQPAAYNEVFNIGADQPTTVNELATLVARAMGVPPAITHLEAAQGSGARVRRPLQDRARVRLPCAVVARRWPRSAWPPGPGARARRVHLHASTSSSPRICLQAGQPEPCPPLRACSGSRSGWQPRSSSASPGGACSTAHCGTTRPSFAAQAAGIVSYGVPKTIVEGEVVYGMWHPPLYLYSRATAPRSSGRSRLGRPAGRCCLVRGHRPS